MNRQTRTGLDAAKRNALKAQLEARALQLRDEIRQSLLRLDREDYSQVANQVLDLEDASLLDLLVDLNLADIDRDLGEFRDIEAALTRMREGRYGFCEECREPIDVKRLEANPTATYCVRHQAERERLRVQTPSL